METENEIMIDWWELGKYGFDIANLDSFYNTRKFRFMLYDILEE